MKLIYEEWGRYLETIQQNKQIKYVSIHSIKIPRIKERCAGCCYFDGKIIGISNSSREIAIIDPVNDSVSFMGMTNIGTFKWTGGCQYHGKCFGFPRKNNNVLSIDINSNHFEIIPLNTIYRGEHHYSGVVTPGGIVYQPPRNTDHVLCIDLNSFHTWKIPMPNLDGECRYSSAVLHPNGDIYLIPERGFRHALIHIDTGTIEYFGEKSEHLVFGVVVGIDGNIYGYSKEGAGILRISVKENKVEYICQNIGNPDCYGSVVGINGKIYGIPGDGNNIWEFDIERQEAKVLFALSESGYAKCAGGGVGPDGTIVMIPCFGEYVYLIKTDLPFSGDVNNCFINTNY